MEPYYRDLFLRFRASMMGVAYRMTGSLSIAEDVTQDVFLRWHKTRWDQVENPRAWFLKVTTRLCLDWLKSSRAQREMYVGSWLPDPLLETDNAPQMVSHQYAQDLSVAFLVLLQELSPAERAIFILHDLFETPFAELSSLLERSEGACRQLARRARQRMAKCDWASLKEEEGGSVHIAELFLKASREGDIAALRTLLAEDVCFVSDGGGKRLAALRVIEGLHKVCRLFEGLARQRGGKIPPVLYRGAINGIYGFVTLETDGLLQTTVPVLKDGLIRQINIVRNPDKLINIGRKLL